MYCPNCGNYNEEDADFCGSCGSPLQNVTEGRTGAGNEQLNGDFSGNGIGQNPQGPQSAAPAAPVPGKKKSKKIWLILAAVFVVAAAAAAVVFLWILPQQQEKRYTALLDEGNRYLEEMDYEKAEDVFLEAIAIEPRKEEPYVKLAGLYLDRGEREKAKQIIADAKENIPEEERTEIKKLEEEREDELNGQGSVYDWVVQPEIEADDIYYLKETDSTEYPYNEMERQMFTDYAVIKQGDSYGLIDSEGEILGDVDYEEITSGYGYYLLKREEPAYDSEYMMETDSYYLYGDEILPAVAIAGDVYGFKGAFYYCNGLQNIFDAYGEEMLGPPTWTEPEDAIPVKASDTILEDVMDAGGMDTDEWLRNLPGGYGIYYGDSMATDFIYDACGSQSDGLLAVEQDGKWGYADSQGNIVIPLEYDASWTQYVPQNGDAAQDYCYAASEGYVVLVKDGIWEMRNTDGDPVIDPGVFEEMRPVYEGKCWVKQDGKWGIISLKDADDADVSEEEPEEEESGLSAESSVEEITEAVLEHLNESLGEDGGSYSISDSEMQETDTGYWFLVRYSLPQEEADRIIASGGMPSANQHAGEATVDLTTGTAVWEPIMGEREEWQLW